jgi:hypothetical protein
MQGFSCFTGKFWSEMNWFLGQKQQNRVLAAKVVNFF